MSADLLPLLGRATEAARDDFQDRLNGASAWVDWICAGAPNASGCVVCGANGPLEDHHVSGRLHGDLTVPACVTCHRRLSERQAGWDPRWLSDERSPTLDESLLLRGLSDLCEERGRWDSAFHALGKRLRAQYARVARGTVS